MKLGIMQPYIFPYIGYFQLINAVEKFVMYDDVAYIKQGWINRNKILLNGKEFLFSVPLANASSFNTIAQTEINTKLYPDWKNKFQKTLVQAYSKAPLYNIVMELLDVVLSKNATTISELAIQSLVSCTEYLQVKTEFVLSATSYNNTSLKAQDRVIDICKIENATEYINPIGGQELYSKEFFETQSIKLNFIKSQPVIYTQFKNEFVPWLSIIDILMFNSIEHIGSFLNSFELV